MKNLHLEHPEDLILEGHFSVFGILYGNAHISLKIDGAPSIVFGTNPENGKFFVGTKSVFNKKKIKICYKVADIEELYNKVTHGSLIEVLIWLFCFQISSKKILVFSIIFNSCRSSEISTFL